jgi:excisionase family DNA binding protein
MTGWDVFCSQKEKRSMAASLRSVPVASTQLWTVEEVAEYLRLQPETVRAKARKGEIPAVKVGKRIWRFDIKEIVACLNISKE